MSTMTDAEKEVLHSYLDSAVHYLEFGSGESTIYAAGVPTIQSITSVESSEQYINDHLKGDPAIATAVSQGRLCFHLVDIGETIAWGEPVNNAKIHLWPNYSLSVFAQRRAFDLYLIDGRFRVACALNCLLNSSDDCTIMIHDFWNRPEYYVLLEFLQTERRVDTLGVFKKKEVVRRDKVQSLIRKYQCLPRDKSVVYRMKEKITRLFR